jgi:hypothetical protein
MVSTISNHVAADLGVAERVARLRSGLIPAGFRSTEPFVVRSCALKCLENSAFLDTVAFAVACTTRYRRTDCDSMAAVSSWIFAFTMPKVPTVPRSPHAAVLYGGRAIASTLSRLPAGAVAKSVSNRILFLVAVLLEAAAAFGIGFSSDVWMLVVFVVIDGVAFGVFLATSQSYIVESISPTKVGGWLGVYSAAGAVGETAGAAAMGTRDELVRNGAASITVELRETPPHARSKVTLMRIAAGST